MLSACQAGRRKCVIFPLSLRIMSQHFFLFWPQTETSDFKSINVKMAFRIFFANMHRQMIQSASLSSKRITPKSQISYGRTASIHSNTTSPLMQSFSGTGDQRQTRDFMSFTDAHVFEYIKYLERSAESSQKLERSQRSTEFSCARANDSSPLTSVSAGDKLKRDTSMTLQEILPNALEGIETSYKFQNRVIELMRAKGVDVVAWRVAATDKKLQRQWAIDAPVVAPVFSTMLYKDEDEVSINRHKIMHMEVNFAFRLGKDIDYKDFVPIEAEKDRTDASFQIDLPKIPVSSILPYVDMFYPVIDLTGSRYPTRAPHSSALVADMVGGAAAIMGTGVPVEKWINYPLDEFPCVLFQEDEPVATGKGDVVLKNPLNSILYLAQNLHTARPCKVARKGSIVFSGPCTITMPARVGRFIAHFGPLGKVTVNIIA